MSHSKCKDKVLRCTVAVTAGISLFCYAIVVAYYIFLK